MTKVRRSADAKPQETRASIGRHACQRCGEQPGIVRYETRTAKGIFRARWCDTCCCTWGSGKCQMLATIFMGRGVCKWHDWCRDNPSDASRFEAFSAWLQGWKGKYGLRADYQRSVWALAKESELAAMVGF